MAPQFEPLRGRLSFRLLESTDSTNLEMRRLIEAGECPDRFVLQAREQSQGRGRLGRAWLSARGNVFMTLAFRAGRDLRHLAEASFVAPLAVLDLVHKLYPQADIKLKWPNDVLVGNRKLSGILLETVLAPGDDHYWLLVGVGINVMTAPEIGDYETACLHEIDPAISLPPEGQLGRFFADCLVQRLDQWREQGFAPIRDTWLTHAARRGEMMTVFVGNERKTGIFQGLSEDGALQLATAPGQISTIHAGDVIWSGLAPLDDGISKTGVDDVIGD